MAQDARKFLVTSDYPVPVLVAKWSGSTVLGAYETKKIETAHGLNFMPLLIGQWSLNANFSPSYDAANSGGRAIGLDVSQSTYSTNEKNTINVMNLSSSSIIFYYRLFAFMPPNYSGTAPSIDDNTNFKLNTDYNYPKLYKADVIQMSYGDSPTTIVHNLGYIPQVRVWRKDINGLSPSSILLSPNGGTSSMTEVDTQKVVFDWSHVSSEVYYHIYADEA